MERSNQMKVPKHVVDWAWSILTEERKAELRDYQDKIDAAKLAYAKTLAANRAPGWIHEVARRAFGYQGQSYECAISVKDAGDGKVELAFAWNRMPDLPPVTRSGLSCWAFFEGEQEWAGSTKEAVELEFGAINSFPSATVGADPEPNSPVGRRTTVMLFEYWRSKRHEQTVAEPEPALYR